MKTVQLYGDYLRFFLPMDPFHQADMLAIDGSFALGTTVDGEDGSDIPAGLLIASRESDRLLIRWLYVKPGYRGEGIGSELMRLAFTEASMLGMTEVAARITEDYDEAGLYWDTDSFFTNDVFSEYEDMLPELHFSVNEISKI
ncbi:MAG: GNAT family N-acetyltransferase, partial [Lachnospiraceae bacterium]|nr:GNAT family N-acetyltransferase [Lachnospiraceae bacterium]